MTEDSNESYYRTYADTPWYRGQIIFKDGDPRIHLFTDATMNRILKALGKRSSISEQLRAELRDIAYCYLAVAVTTPLGISNGPRAVTLTKRAIWIHRHLLKPATRLLQALSDRTAHMRSEYPDPMDQEPPDRQRLVSELEKLTARSRELEVCLSDRKNYSLRREYVIDLVRAITVALKREFPDLKISRGTHDTEFGMQGRYLEALKVAITEILPNEKVSSKIVGEMRKLF